MKRRKRKDTAKAPRRETGLANAWNTERRRASKNEREREALMELEWESFGQGSEKKTRGLYEKEISGGLAWDADGDTRGGRTKE